MDIQKIYNLKGILELEACYLNYLYILTSLAMNIGRNKMQSSLLKFSKKGLVLTHLNICSLRNKVEEITTLCQSENIHIFPLTETHLDDKF